MVTSAIKSGYKTTELGRIPDDWEVKTFVEVMTGFASGQTPSRSNPQYYKGNIPWITSGELNYNIVTDTVEKITPEAQKNTNLKTIPKGTFLFAITGLEAEGTRGSCAITGIEATTNQSCMALYPKQGLLITPYLFHYYVAYGKRLALEYCQGTKQQSYTGGIAKLLPIILPPSTKEQSAIARVLSDTASLIESLDKLIAKKKNIKQGTIQQLLTGKRRLPGFKGEWEAKKLGEIGDISGAGVDKKSKPDEISVRLLNYMDVYKRDFIYSKELNHWVTAPSHQATRCAVKKGDIFFTPSSEMRWDIGISAVAMEDMPDVTYSYHIDRLRLFDDWDIKFRTYIFKTKNFLDQCETTCEGSGKRYVISLRKFRDLTIKYPKDLKEQSAISQILFDMDTEIGELEQKRDKYKLLKAGMMQQLLTGRIRLLC